MKRLQISIGGWKLIENKLDWIEHCRFNNPGDYDEPEAPFFYQTFLNNEGNPYTQFLDAEQIALMHTILEGRKT